MNGKIIAALIVTTVTIAIVGAAGVTLLNAGNYGTHMDYSILDNPEGSVREGLSIHTDDPYGTAVVKVTSVEGNGNITFTRDITSSNLIDDFGPLADYNLREIIPFDFMNKDEIPEGIDVSVNGDTYIINGHGDVTQYGINISLMYKNFTITYNDGSVSDINGISGISENATGTFVETQSRFYVANGILKQSDGFMHITETLNTTKTDFIKNNFTKFDAAEYIGCTISDEPSDKFDGRECAVKIINGNCTKDGKTYRDFKVFIYNGFIVKSVGTVNEISCNTTNIYCFE